MRPAARPTRSTTRVGWSGSATATAGKDGITKNLWQTKLPAAQSPWNYPLFFGMPIVDRPLRGEKGEGIGTLHILGNTLPSFRMTFTNNIQYKRLTAYALLDGTFGHKIHNQGEGWGLLDFSSAYFDQGGQRGRDGQAGRLRLARRFARGRRHGGFYDILGPNNYNVESGSYAKLREVSLTYRVGALRGIGGDWTLGVIGRNLYTFTNYSRLRSGNRRRRRPNQSGSGLINQVDAFGFPTLRTFTFTLSTRF